MRSPPFAGSRAAVRRLFDLPAVLIPFRPFRVLPGQISQSRAAELAGISRHEFLHSLSRFQVSPFQVTPEELAEELARG